jgi:hypothetical protein
VQQGHDVPPILLGGSCRKCGIQIVRHGEQSAHDVIGLEPIGLDQRAQQLISRRKNLGGIVSGDGSGPPDPMQSD